MVVQEYQPGDDRTATGNRKVLIQAEGIGKQVFGQGRRGLRGCSGQ